MKIKRIAHRGFSSEAPENTQASFAMAVEGDFYGVECDIWKSKDGVYVVSHDGHLRRMCGIDRWIPQMTFGEVISYPVTAGKKREEHPLQHLISFSQYLSIMARSETIHPIVELKMDYTTVELREIVDLVKQKSKCMSWDGNKLSIKTADCVRCMHCINTMPRALHIGDERGASILVGAKAPVVDGAQMGSLLVPFISCEAPYDEIKEVIEKIWDWWMEEGKNRERVGETMKRLSFQKLLEVTDTEAAPYHVTAPRSNPYIFFKEEEVPGGWNRDLAEFRKRHQR